MPANQEVEVVYHVHPVGQGLFITGLLPRLSPNFHWVYDCGSASSRTLITAAINDWSGRTQLSAPHIHLAFVSHFDKDHVSGLVTLLGIWSVDTLVLPYMPLWRRLEIAFSAPDVTDELIEFCRDPVAFVTGNGTVSRVVVVLPSVPPGPPPPAPDDLGPLDRLAALDRDSVLRVVQAAGGEPPPADIGSPTGQTSLMTLASGGRLVAGAAWEFVPYNDANLAHKVTASFRREVENAQTVILGANQPQRMVELARLRRLYDAQFGNSARARNEISLFVWTGPVGGEVETGRLIRAQVHAPYFPLVEAGRLGALFSGDGYLDTPDRLVRLTHYLGTRIQELGVFQVMHHGAMGNWHAGVADALNPAFSIFSSDPTREPLLHPHAAVLRDFWQHGAVQVDAERAFEVWGIRPPS